MSHIKIGDMLVEQGNLPAALDAFNAALAIRQRLAKADPANAGWQKDAEISRARMGRLKNAVTSPSASVIPAKAWLRRSE